MPPSKKKILIADNSKELLDSIIKNERALSFEIEIVEEGLMCLEKVKTFEPDLIIVEFMLPGAHGIEVLQTAKKTPCNKKFGGDFNRLPLPFTKLQHRDLTAP